MIGAMTQIAVIAGRIHCLTYPPPSFESYPCAVGVVDLDHMFWAFGSITFQNITRRACKSLS